MTFGFSDPDTFVRGIAVCLNKGKDEIKGVKLSGAKLNRVSGALIGAGTKKWERTNCKYWGEFKNCPEGKLASAFKVYYLSEVDPDF